MDPETRVSPQNQVCIRGRGSIQATADSEAMGLAAAHVAGTAAASTEAASAAGTTSADAATVSAMAAS